MNTNSSRLPMPEKFEIKEGLQSLEISYPWMSPKYYFLLFFTIVWVVMFIASLGILAAGFILFPEAMEEHWKPSYYFYMLPTLLLHAGTSAFLIYGTACGFLNKTYIKVNHSEIDISFAPIYAPGAKTIPASDIKQLFVREKVSKGDGSVAIGYQVEVIDTNEKKHPLIKDLDEAQQARYIEQKIEQFLGIKDEAVHGEYPK